MAKLNEAGRVLNSKNESALKNAFKTLMSVLKNAGIDLSKDEEETEAKEAGGFSVRDLTELLYKALKQQLKSQGVVSDESYYYTPMIEDIFDDYLVYRQNYGGSYYRCDFSVTDSGDVSLGDPIEVVRKVDYLPITSETPAVESDQELELSTDYIQLVEKAVKNGETTLKLIAPGWGSSGYYSAEVLKRDGPNVFTKGTHNFIDHPTEVEEAERPEGSIQLLGSTLLENAYWKNDPINGPGLYAKAKVNPDFETTLDTFAEDIGMSIRAGGKGHYGEAEGRKGVIIDAITVAKSVDYVTRPGAGGKVVTLFESTRKPKAVPKGESTMADNTDLTEIKEALKALQEQNAQLTRSMRETQLSDRARSICTTEIGKRNLPDAISAKLIERLSTRYTTKDDGSLDVDAYATLIEAEVQQELSYLSSLGALAVPISGFGASNANTGNTQQVAESDLASAFAALGMSESSAKIAAAGRS